MNILTKRCPAVAGWLGATLLLLACVAAYAVAAGTTLLSEDFEAASSGIPAGWALFRDSKWGEEVLLSSERAHSGFMSIKLIDPAPDRAVGLRSDLIPITDRGPYRARTAVYNDGSGAGLFYLEFWNSDRVRTEVYTVSSTRKDQWDEITVEALAPEDAAYVTVLIYSTGPAVGAVYFDHVVLEKRPSVAESGAYTVSLARFGDEGAIESVGRPIRFAQIGSAALGWDREGNPTWYFTVPSPSEDRLYAVRIRDGKLLGTYPYPGGGSQSWAVLPMPDGNVYFTSGSTVFKFVADREEVIRIGSPNGMIWDLEIDPQGIIWGGTYPRSHIFRLDPSTDTIVDLGPVSDQDYARTIGASERYIFVGLGPRTDLVAYDKETGEVRSILPDQYKDDQGFANLTDVRGNRLFAWAGDNTKPPVTMLIYDTDTLELIDSIPGIARPLSPLHNGRYVYFRLYSTPMRYDLVTDTYRSHGLVLPESRALGFAELDESLVPEPRRSRFQGENLVGITVDHYWAINLESFQLLQVPIQIEAAPIRINSLGARGNLVYGGGIAPGGVFLYDAGSGETIGVPPRGQADSVLLHEGRLYFATYPGAYLRYFDLDSGETHTIGQVGDEQDRPVNMVEYDGLIYVATVPDYGKHGGALVVLDPSTERYTTHRNVVPGHSVVSLAAHDGVIYGGTSTEGGLGIAPVPGDGKLFAWDPVQEKVLWVETPLPGEPAVGALIMGPDGLLWGAGTNSIFAFDVATGQVVWKERVSPGAPLYTRREAFAATFDKYVTITLARRYFIVIDTEEKSVRIVPSEFDRVVATENGDLYVNRLDELYRIPFEVWTASR